MKISVSALYSAGECVAPADWNTHGSPRPYRLYYILGGDAVFFTGGEEIKLEVGKFYLFPSSLPFNVRQDPERRLDHLYFDFMMSPAVVSSRPLSCSGDAHPVFASLLPFMRECVRQYRYGERYELKDAVICALEAFLSVFCEIASAEISFSADILKALEYIESHYSEEISVRGIAELLHLDEDYFIRKFKKALGTTPYSYIRNLRLAVVREMRYSGETLSASSAAAGFKYASSYCRAIGNKNKKI